MPNTTFWPISKDGNTVGKVTSAVYSPRLEQNIALAMVAKDLSVVGTQVEITMPSGTQMATVVERPFYDPKKQITCSSTLRSSCGTRNVPLPIHQYS